MVTFCCDGCGESLKKAKVDAHAAKCRECYSVSCIDCSLSFPGDEYRYHTSCISEAERYEKTIYRGARKLDDSGTGHRQQQFKGKKLTPQELWSQTIQTAAETAPPSLKSHMDQLTMMENVPRKEKQFRNFTVNSLGLRGSNGEKIKSEIWALLAKVREDDRKMKEEQVEKKKQQLKNTEKTPKEPRLRAPSVSDDDDSSGNSTNKDMVDLPSKKVLTKAMKKALKKAPNKQLKFKSLRKQMQESLSFKADKDGKKRLEKLLHQCVDANPKRLVLDGKILTLKK